MGRFGAYIRVSVVGPRDRDSFLSPRLQRDRIEAWAQANGHEIVDWREDLDVSGGAKNRPNLEALVRAVERRELDGIVVARLDRFARSLGVAIRLLDRMHESGGKFAAVADGFDTSTPYGQLALNVMLAFADFELKRYRAQWLEAKARLVRDGRVPGGAAPFGYRTGDDGRLVPHSDEGPLVTGTFRRRATGESISTLARSLQAAGALTGRGGVPHRRFVADMLSNRVYLGELRSGQDINPAAHPPLTTTVIFERASLVAGARPGAGQKGKLPGLVRCQGCRYIMGATWVPYRNGKRVRAYRCRGGHAAGACPAPAFALEHQLVEIVEREFFREAANVTMRAAGDMAALETLEAEVQRKRHALLTYRDESVIEALGAREYADGLTVRQAALDLVEREYAAELGRRPDGLPDAAALKLSWPEVDSDTRARLFRAVFDAVVVSKPKVHRSHREPLIGRLRLIPVGSLPVDVPRPGRKPIAIVPFGFEDPPGAWITPLEPLAEDRPD